MRAVTAAAGLLALASTVLVAVALATNWWLIFVDKRDTRVTPSGDVLNAHPKNPVREDPGLTDLVRYRADHIGVWVACFNDTSFAQVSCGLIDGGCRANICWKNVETSDAGANVTAAATQRTCMKKKVAPLAGKCAAFQAVRALSVIGAFLSIAGSVFLLATLCAFKKAFGGSGSACTLLGALAMMIAFAVFLGAVFNAGGLSTVAKLGWSYKLLIAAWVIGILSAILASAGTAAGDSGKKGGDTSSSSSD